MPETMTTYEHVQLDVSGVPIIVGTNMKVVELVMAQLAHGWSPEELHFQHPYLSLGQIHPPWLTIGITKRNSTLTSSGAGNTLRKHAGKPVRLNWRTNFSRSHCSREQPCGG